MLARSKLNSKESKISEALIKNGINHEDFMTIINEEKTYLELKESIKMKKKKKSDNEKFNLIEEGQQIGIDEAIKHNDIIIKVSHIKKMSSYCLKSTKNTETINPRVSKTNNVKTMMLSKCAIYGSKKTRFIKKEKTKSIIK